MIPIFSVLIVSNVSSYIINSSSRSSRFAAPGTRQSILGQGRTDRWSTTVAVHATGAPSPSAPAYPPSSTSTNAADSSTGASTALPAAPFQGYPKNGSRWFTVLPDRDRYANVSRLFARPTASRTGWTHAICASKPFAILCSQSKYLHEQVQD